jgi:hypothetical protein
MRQEILEKGSGYIVYKKSDEKFVRVNLTKDTTWSKFIEILARFPNNIFVPTWKRYHTGDDPK